MRAIVTGQVGIEKKPYLKAVAQLAAQAGDPLHVYHVGDRMYAEAPDVRPGGILDLPLSRLHSIRRAVFKDIIAESADQRNVIVNTHATFRWRHGLFRAFDFDQMQTLRPDMFICMVDNIEALHHRLHTEHRVDASFKDMMVWREEEIMATELLALGLGGRHTCHILPRGRETRTTRTCYRLVCRPELKKVYLSFPMSHVYDMPDILEEIDTFREVIADQFTTFNPADVDEKLLLEAAIEAAKSGTDFVEGRQVSDDGVSETFRVSVKQVLEVAGDIDGQIYARDFQLIDQSDMIISLVPELAGGVPGLSSGVERELQHAYEASKDVYVIWKPERNPSPFITETATAVFGSTEQLLEHFAAAGLLTSKA